MPSIKIDPATFGSIEKLKSQLLSVSDITTDAVKAVLGRTSYYGRSMMIDVEKKYFKFGRVYSKDGGAQRQHTQFSVDDGYIIVGKTTKKGTPYRLIQYSFENVSAMKSKAAFLRSVKKAYVTSKMMNLWENTTKAYKKPSPYIVYQNGSRGRWEQGEQRPGKNFYTKNFSAVKNAVPIAVGRTEKELQVRINSVTK